MPLVGANHGSDLANESGSDNRNEISLQQLLMNLATSGNQKHVKLASDLLELDLIQDNLGSDKNEQELTLENNVKSDNLGPDFHSQQMATKTLNMNQTWTGLLLGTKIKELDQAPTMLKKLT